MNKADIFMVLMVGVLIGFMIAECCYNFSTKRKEKPTYKYFIGYAYGVGFGDLEITLEKPIACWNDLIPIREFIVPLCQKKIKEKNPEISEKDANTLLQNIIITNWKQFGKD